jgi:hypothetical protein
MFEQGDPLKDTYKHISCSSWMMEQAETLYKYIILVKQQAIFFAPVPMKMGLLTRYVRMLDIKNGNN